MKNPRGMEEYMNAPRYPTSGVAGHAHHTVTVRNIEATLRGALYMKNPRGGKRPRGLIQGGKVTGTFGNAEGECSITC